MRNENPLEPALEHGRLRIPPGGIDKDQPFGCFQPVQMIRHRQPVLPPRVVARALARIHHRVEPFSIEIQQIDLMAGTFQRRDGHIARCGGEAFRPG